MLKTRLDGRSEENSTFDIKNAQGKIIATVKLLNNFGANLEISTSTGLYIEKPSGWTSQPK